MKLLACYNDNENAKFHKAFHITVKTIGLKCPPEEAVKTFISRYNTSLLSRNKNKLILKDVHLAIRHPRIENVYVPLPSDVPLYYTVADGSTVYICHGEISVPLTELFHCYAQKKKISSKHELHCCRYGCMNQLYNDSNGKSSIGPCLFHKEVPVFQRTTATFFWRCCSRKKVSNFSELLEVRGCQSELYCMTADDRNIIGEASFQLFTEAKRAEQKPALLPGSTAPNNEDIINNNEDEPESKNVNGEKFVLAPVNIREGKELEPKAREMSEIETKELVSSSEFESEDGADSTLGNQATDIAQPRSSNANEKASGFDEDGKETKNNSNHVGDAEFREERISFNEDGVQEIKTNLAKEQEKNLPVNTRGRQGFERPTFKQSLYRLKLPKHIRQRGIFKKKELPANSSVSGKESSPKADFSALYKLKVDQNIKAAQEQFEQREEKEKDNYVTITTSVSEIKTSNESYSNQMFNLDETYYKKLTKNFPELQDENGFELMICESIVNNKNNTKTIPDEEGESISTFEVEEKIRKIKGANSNQEAIENFSGTEQVKNGQKMHAVETDDRERIEEDVASEGKSKRAAINILRSEDQESTSSTQEKICLKYDESSINDTDNLSGQEGNVCCLHGFDNQTEEDSFHSHVTSKDASNGVIFDNVLNFFQPNNDQGEIESCIVPNEIKPQSYVLTSERENKIDGNVSSQDTTDSYPETQASTYCERSTNDTDSLSGEDRSLENEEEISSVKYDKVSKTAPSALFVDTVLSFLKSNDDQEEMKSIATPNKIKSQEVKDNTPTVDRSENKEEASDQESINEEEKNDSTTDNASIRADHKPDQKALNVLRAMDSVDCNTLKSVKTDNSLKSLSSSMKRNVGANHNVFSTEKGTILVINDNSEDNELSEHVMRMIGSMDSVDSNTIFPGDSFTRFSSFINKIGVDQNAYDGVVNAIKHEYKRQDIEEEELNEIVKSKIISIIRESFSNVAAAGAVSVSKRSPCRETEQCSHSTNSIPDDVSNDISDDEDVCGSIDFFLCNCMA